MSADWARDVVREQRRNRVTAGHGLRETQTDNGKIISLGTVHRVAAAKEVATDTASSIATEPRQRSIERGERGLQLRQFEVEEPHAKVNGLLSDWIEADPETGQLRAKSGRDARCIELVVRVTDGTGQPDSDKNVKYLRLDNPGDDPANPDDVSEAEPAPPPPCGHPGNEGGGAADGEPPNDDHPGDDPGGGGDGDHPGNTVSPPCGGPSPT